MSKKDYEKIAAAIQTTLNGRTTTQPDQKLLDAVAVGAIRTTTRAIADAMQDANSRFDRAKFMQACGFIE